MKTSTVIYVHGMGGSADEAERFVPLFPECEVVGFDYKSETPWDAAREFGAAFAEYREKYERVYLIANSIGAFYSMNALSRSDVSKAWFISPIVDMERLILDMMTAAGVTGEELKEKGIIDTGSGPALSWEYLCRVRARKIEWDVPTSVLYGSKDVLQTRDTVSRFCREHGAKLTVMEGGEHWFHTAEQLRFLDRWIENDKEIL